MVEAVGFGTAVALNADSTLIVSTWADRADDELRLQYRAVDTKGRVRDGLVRVTTVAAATENLTRIRVPPGSLLHASLEDTTAASRVGDVFARISVGGETAGNPFRFPLAQGFIGGGSAIAWPNILNAPAEFQLGRNARFVGADPAANVEATLTLPAGVLVLPESAHVRLVADATAANRTVQLLVEDDAGNDVFRTSGEVFQVAGETVDYFFSLGAAASVTATLPYITVAMLAGTFSENWVLSTITINRQVGDNFGPLTLFGRRFFLLNL